MPTVFDSTTASALSVANLSCDVPSNTSAHRLIAFVSASFVGGVTPDPVFTFTGWTSINSVLGTGITGSEVFTQAYYHAGGLAGQADISANHTASRFNVVILSIADASSTLDGSSIGAASDQRTLSVSSIITTKPNVLLLKCWATEGGIEAVQQEVQAVAGASGQKTYFAVGYTSANIMVAVAPFEGPTTPLLTFPDGGETLTAGATVSIAWNPSSSPTAAQSSLQYNLDYSANNGITWTSIVALTSAGVTSYAWTVPSTVGSGYKVRIRSYDSAITTYSLEYSTGAAFSVVAETTPGQPVITAPTNGSAQNKAVNVTVAWVHQGGVGNPQTEFTLQWATNSAFSGATTIGPTATATQSTSIDFSAQAHGTTIYVKVKTKGVSLESAYSNTVSFIVASLPATPNITAPVAASPPTTPNPTITFTEADAFVARKIRVTIGGIETYNSGTVVSTATSFTSPYAFANGITVVLYLSVQNNYGLWSAEDSETLTPSYVGPATPTITLTESDDGGYILITIANSDTPSYNEVWRRVLGQDADEAIQISPSSVAVDGSFADYGVQSGITYVYFARAVNAGTTLFTDSLTAQGSVTLGNVFVSLPTATSGTANASACVSLLNQVSGPLIKTQLKAGVKLLGRQSPVPVIGQITSGVMSQTVIILCSQSGLYAQTMTILESGQTVCVRDQQGDRIFGKVGTITVTDYPKYWQIQFTIVEEYHNESTTGLDPAIEIISGFTPVDIPSCVLWLEADHILGVAHGGAIANWPDISGQNNHAVQADGAKQPTLYLDRINGMASVKFDGTADSLVTAGSLWTGAQTRGMFVIYRNVSTGTTRQICGQSTASTSFTSFALGFDSAATFNPRVKTPLTSSLNFQQSSDNVQDWQYAAATYDGTTIQFYWNGVQAQAGAVASLNTTAAGFRVGSRLIDTVEDRYWDGEVAVIACFTSYPSIEQIIALFRTWAGKYGINY